MDPKTNHSSLQLYRLQVRHEAAFRALLKDWESDWDHITPSIIKQDSTDFTKYVHRLESWSNGKDMPHPRVPGTTFFLMDEEQSEIRGVVNVRHYLNDWLKRGGGHIGYGVPPSHRGRGYATLMLKLSLEFAYARGIEEVLLTVEPDNPASQKVILNNGGVFGGMGELRGIPVEKYWFKPDPAGK